MYRLSAEIRLQKLTKIQTLILSHNQLRGWMRTPVYCRTQGWPLCRTNSKQDHANHNLTRTILTYAKRRAVSTKRAVADKSTINGWYKTQFLFTDLEFLSKYARCLKIVFPYRPGNKAKIRASF